MRVTNRGIAYELQLQETRRHQTPERLRGFEAALVALYSRVLGFLASAYRVRGLNALHRAIHAFWKPEDIVEFESHCVKLEDEIKAESDAWQTFSTKAMSDAIMEILKSTDSLTPQVSETRTLLESLKHEYTVEKRKRVLMWVSSIQQRTTTNWLAVGGHLIPDNGYLARVTTKYWKARKSLFCFGSTESVSLPILLRCDIERC